MSRLVKYEWGPEGPPPLTDAQKAEIEALKSMSDADINFDDIPPLPDSFWDAAEKRRRAAKPSARKQAR